MEGATRYVPPPLAEILRPDHTAIVVVDMQNDQCHAEGLFGKQYGEMPMVVPVTKNINRLLAVARPRGVNVVYLQQTTLPNGQSDSPAWLYFKQRYLNNPNHTIEGEWGEQILDELAPLPGDLVVKKFRSSGFYGTCLNLLLRARGVQTLVVTGFVTEGCVDSTIRDAGFHDYFVVVPEECVGSVKTHLYQPALEILRTRSEVVSINNLFELWQ